MTAFQLRQHIRSNILTSLEVCELLQISRQRLSAIVKENKLIPLINKSQGMIFLRIDIDKYIEEKSKNSITSNYAPIYDYSHNTDKSIAFFENNISSLSQIHSVFIYFDKMDALLNNFYLPSESYISENLRDLDIPYLIIRDVNGKELWLGGCRCGYNGNGSRASEDILKSLVSSGRLNLKEKDIDAVFSERVINIYVNEDNTTDIICRESVLDSHDGKGNAHAYYCRDHIVLLQADAHVFHAHREHVELSIIEKYRAFIPNPKEVICFPSSNAAKEAGYVGHNDDWRPETYTLIVIDSTGRELWLNPTIMKNISYHRQDTVKEILEACGFNFEQRTGVSQKISDWLDITIHFIRPSLEIMRYVK